MITRLYKWRNNNKQLKETKIKYEGYNNKAFIELHKINNKYSIVCNIADILNDYTILATTEAEALRIYNDVKLDLSKIIDMSLCCFNEEISKQFLSLDCSEFQNKYKRKRLIVPLPFILFYTAINTATQKYYEYTIYILAVYNYNVILILYQLKSNVYIVRI